MPGPSVPGAPVAVGPVCGTVGPSAQLWHIVRSPDGTGPACCGKAPAFWHERVRVLGGFAEHMRVCPACRRAYERSIR